MKTLKSFFLILFWVAIAATASSQGNKINLIIPYEWNPSVVPIDCIGDYSGIIEMDMTFFYTGKVLNKASGIIADADGNSYLVESLFNCHLFVRGISASGNSNQVMTFLVRSADNGKLVATVHFTWHYEDWNGEGSASMINVQTICH